MYIYKIENTINNKVYIGQTINKPEYRWREHQRISKNTDNPDFSYIHSAMRKYGVNNFNFQVIDKANSKEELDAKEKQYISSLNTLVRNGYNISSGGQFTKVIPESTRQKISESKKGPKNPNWGKVYTQEEREAHRQMMLKRYSNPEERLKNSQRSKEVWQRPGYKEKMHLIKINQFSEETKKIIGQKSRQKWQNKEFREKMSQKRKAEWADPIKRAEMLRKRKETKLKNPDCNKKIASRWLDPEFRKRWYLARYNKVINEKI